MRSRSYGRNVSEYVDSSLSLEVPRRSCLLCNIKITPITGWRLHHCVPLPWVVLRVQTTASCSIQSATTGFIVNIFPYRNRVSPKEAFEEPEPDDGKLSRPVLRGLAPSNGG